MLSDYDIHLTEEEKQSVLETRSTHSKLIKSDTDYIFTVKLLLPYFPINIKLPDMVIYENRSPKFLILEKEGALNITNLEENNQTNLLHKLIRNKIELYNYYEARIGRKGSLEQINLFSRLIRYHRQRYQRIVNEQEKKS